MTARTTKPKPPTPPPGKPSPRPAAKAGRVETAITRMVTALRKDHQLTTASEATAALTVAAARGLDQALTADNQYGIRQSVVSLRELLADLFPEQPSSAVDPIDELLAAISGGPVFTA